MTTGNNRDGLVNLIESVDENRDRIRKLEFDQGDKLLKALKAEMVNTVMSIQKDEVVFLKQVRDFTVAESNAMREQIMQFDAALQLLFRRMTEMEEQQGDEGTGLTGEELDKLTKLADGTAALIESIEPSIGSSNAKAKQAIDELKSLCSECQEILANFEEGEEEEEADPSEENASG